VESSEANQAQHLYFSTRAVQILQKQERERAGFAREREHRLKEQQVKFQGTADLFPDFSTLDQFDSVSIQKRQEEKATAARDAKVRSALHDMDKFDSAAIQAQPKCQLDIPIYADGRGDQCEYEAKIWHMKCKREDERRNEEERSLIRKGILNRATGKTPLRMVSF